MGREREGKAVIEADYLFRLPDPKLPPLELFIAVTLFSGRGRRKPGWFAHPRQFASLDSAQEFLEGLGKAHSYGRVLHFMDPEKV